MILLLVSYLIKLSFVALSLVTLVNRSHNINVVAYPEKYHSKHLLLPVPTCVGRETAPLLMPKDSNAINISIE